MERRGLGKGLVTLLLAGGLLVSAVAPQGAAAAATRAEYAQQADPICRSADKRNNARWKRFLKLDKKRKIHAAANALENIGKEFYSSNRDLRLIAPPPGDEAVISAWIGLYDRVGGKWLAGASAYRLNDYSRLDHLITSASRLNRKASKLVADFPFQAC